MKVLLIQLPVPNNQLSNLPLAMGYLKATADSARIPGVQVEILEQAAQDRGGDAFLMDAILAHDPDLIGFSLYTWNSSRVVGLTRKLKELAPEILLLGGGPEVNRDSDFILLEPSFDFLVFGEGERTFLELLQHFANGSPELHRIGGLGFRPEPAGEMLINPSRGAIEDVNLAPSAYLNGTLDGYLGKFMSIELSRWCPSKCTFCYYGRQDFPLGGKRYFDVSRIRAELEYGLARGIEQIHFVEANFNTLPHLSQIYQTIRETGANRQMRFYAEMRGEAIDEAEAERLAECNFGTVEVGLQSAVPEVLAKVRRKNHLPRLIKGVQNLRQRGIEVFLDAILGLPGDTPQTFRQTIDFIEQHELEPYDIFHLQILSGTQLKSEVLAGQHGMKWQNEPPYFVLETSDLSFEQLCQLRRETLERKGDDPAEIQGLPQPSPFALSQPSSEALQSVESNSKPIERVILDLNNLPNLAELARKLASEVTIWLKDGDMSQYEQVLVELSRPNPSNFWHIFVGTTTPLNSVEIIQLARAVHHQTGYLDRLAVFALEQSDPEQFLVSPSVKVYNLVKWQPQLEEYATPQTIWQLELDPTATVNEWQTLLEKVATAPAEGLQIITQPATPPEKLLLALQTLAESEKQLWFSDWATAARLADEANLSYPFTYSNNQYHKLDSAAIAKAQLRWALAKRRGVASKG